MMTLLALLLITGAAAYMIIRPVLSYRSRPWLFDAPSGEEEALRQEQIVALDALRDLAMDYRMGQLSEIDYRTMAAPLQQRAKSTMEYQANRVNQGPDLAQLDDLLEAEILAARRALPANGATRFCPQCGQSVGADFRFCAACGSALPKGDGEPQSMPTTSNRSDLQPAQTAIPESSQPAPAPPLRNASQRKEEQTDGLPEKPLSSGIQQGDSAPVVVAAATRSMRAWWVAAGLFAAVWIVGVAWLYVAGRARQEVQVAVATLSDGPIQVLAAANGKTLAGESDGLHLSTDGSTWTQSAADKRFTSITPLDNDGQNWIGAGEQGLWRSVDGGVQWQLMSTEPPGLLMHTVAVAPGSADSIWGADEQAIYFSHNGGITWRTITSLPPGRIQALTVGQNDVYVGTNRGIFLSRDRGLSWTDYNGSVNGRIGSTDIQALAFDEIGNLLFAGTPRGLYFLNLSSPSGWGQRSLNANVTALALDGANSEALWAGTAHGELFRSGDRGVTWWKN